MLFSPVLSAQLPFCSTWNPKEGQSWFGQPDFSYHLTWALSICLCSLVGSAALSETPQWWDGYSKFLKWERTSSWWDFKVKMAFSPETTFPRIDDWNSLLLKPQQDQLWGWSVEDIVVDNFMFNRLGLPKSWLECKCLVTLGTHLGTFWFRSRRSPGKFIEGAYRWFWSWDSLGSH